MGVAQDAEVAPYARRDSPFPEAWTRFRSIAAARVEGVGRMVISFDALARRAGASR